MKLLLVEDDERIYDFLKKGLSSEGYTVDLAVDGEEGLHLAKNSDYEAIILDIMLPVIDGLTLCSIIRKSKNQVPIIMLTAKDTVEDKVKGLDAGADDYLIKPFSLTELSARIRALIRRRHPLSTNDNIIIYKDLKININTHEVSRNNNTIDLSATEFRLLQYLAEHRHQIVTKLMILEGVWSYNFDPGSNIVDVYIKYLRDKIDKKSTKKLIKTIHGVGYRLCESE